MPDGAPGSGSADGLEGVDGELEGVDEGREADLGDGAQAFPGDSGNGTASPPFERELGTFGFEGGELDAPDAPDSGNGATGRLTQRQVTELRAQEAQEQRRARHQERKARREARPRLRKLRFALVFSGLGVLAVVSWVFGVMMAVAGELPDLEASAQFEQAENSIVYAEGADGERVELATLTGNNNRILVESGQISLLMKQAVVSIEDERFYEHRGVDYLAIARALREDILAGAAVQGGSTITQQFVKNALEAQDNRSILQKLKESALAYQVERQWSKDKILTNYLNNIYFGEGAYGIEAAAKTYFGWNHENCGEEDPATGEQNPSCASQLRVEEAAMLAGMIASPAAYSPKTDQQEAEGRRNLVLDKMHELGYLEISDSELAELKDISLPAPSQIEAPSENSDAPYFTAWLRQQVVDRYGAGDAFGGGLEIVSTLNLELQNAAQEIVSSRVGGLGPTAAVVVLDNDTAEVRAMVGGSDFEESPFNLATNGRRQPGSAFKPFTLVTALADGISPNAVYPSQPVEIPFQANVRNRDGELREVTDVFEVANYEDSYLGSASLYSATTYSDNSVYAQLGTDVGTTKVARMARRLGIQSPIPDNPATILGGMKRGVTPLEMAYAYTTLANGGRQVSGTMASRGNGSGPVAIKKVEDGGEPLADDLGGNGENEATAERAVDEEVATTAVDMLQNVVSSGTGTRASVGDAEVWGKTGTTDNNADAWFVGASDEVTIAVWVGYAEGAIPMETEFGGGPVDGGTIPALIFNDVLTAYSSTQAAEDAEAAAEGETATEPTPTTETATEPSTDTTAPPPEEEPAPEPDGSEGQGGPTEPQEPAPPPQPPPTPAPAPEQEGGGGAAPTQEGALSG